MIFNLNVNKHVRSQASKKSKRFSHKQPYLNYTRMHAHTHTGTNIIEATAGDTDKVIKDGAKAHGTFQVCVIIFEHVTGVFTRRTNVKC